MLTLSTQYVLVAWLPLLGRIVSDSEEVECQWMLLRAGMALAWQRRSSACCMLPGDWMISVQPPQEVVSIVHEHSPDAWSSTDGFDDGSSVIQLHTLSLDIVQLPSQPILRLRLVQPRPLDWIHIRDVLFPLALAPLFVRHFLFALS